MGENTLNIYEEKTLGAPGPEGMDIWSYVPYSILIWATKFLYSNFGLDPFIYSVANA